MLTAHDIKFMLDLTPGKYVYEENTPLLQRSMKLLISSRKSLKSFGLTVNIPDYNTRKNNYIYNLHDTACKGT